MWVSSWRSWRELCCRFLLQFGDSATKKQQRERWRSWTAATTATFRWQRTNRALWKTCCLCGKSKSHWTNHEYVSCFFLTLKVTWFLLMWFRYEKQRSNFVSCLERSECASKPESQCLSADKAKLRSELQDLQVNYKHRNSYFLHKNSCNDLCALKSSLTVTRFFAGSTFWGQVARASTRWTDVFRDVFVSDCTRRGSEAAERRAGDAAEEVTSSEWSPSSKVRLKITSLTL